MKTLAPSQNVLFYYTELKHFFRSKGGRAVGQLCLSGWPAHLFMVNILLTDDWCPLDISHTICDINACYFVLFPFVYA